MDSAQGGANTNMPNAGPLNTANLAFEQALQKCLVKGFYGKFVFTVNIEDGVIQDGEEHVTRKRRFRQK